MRIEESIVCWNFRGVRSGQFLREMKKIMRDFRPMLIVLLEPKISGEAANEICRRIGKNHWNRSKAEGFSGRV